MKRVTILIAMLTIFVSTIMAQQVSVNEAMSRAKTFLQTSSKHRAPSLSGTASPELSLAYTAQNSTKQKNCFYVFNRGTNDGFIIVGGDETAQEILGYSDNGTFDYATAPDNFKWWLSQYQQQITSAISYAEAHPEAVATAKKAKAARKAASSTKSDIPQILSTKWSQNDPFNSELPSLGDNYASLVTGCVATAMAQVMKRYNYPTTGIGTKKSYTQTWSNEDIGTKTFEADFANTTYDWDNMLDDYSNGSSSAAQDKAVGTLMYHCGVAVDMHYGQSGSSASASKIDDALVNYFNYNNSVRYLKRDYYADDAWENIVYNELSNGRPVIYAGQAANNTGHCFVCDGYQASDNTYHINWGWEGLSDGCYALTGTNALAPSEQSTGGAGDGSSYSGSQEMVINIIASEGGLETPVVYFNGVNGSESTTFVLSDGSTTTTEYTYAHGSSKTLTLTDAITNFSRSLTSFTLGVKATDTTTGLEYIFPSNTVANLNYLYGTTYKIAFNPDEKLQFNGTYKINTVVRNTNSISDDDWYEVGVKSGISQPTVTVTGATDPTKTDVDLTINNTEVQATRTIQISHPTAYKGTITYQSSNENVATVDANGVVTGVSTGSATITATAAETTYFKATTKTFNITVTPFVKSDADIAISATTIAVDETATITISGDYDGTATYSSTDATVASVADGVVTGKKAGTATITVTLPSTDKYNANSATFDVTVTGDEIYFTETPYFSNDNNPWSGDAKLHYSIKNNSSSTTVYLLTKLYEGDTQKGGEGTSITTSSKTISGTFNLTDYYSTTSQLIEDHHYTLKFFKSTENNWSNPYNIASIDFTYRSELEYEYTLTDAGIGTLILPFNAEIPTGIKVYECASVDGNTLVLSEVTTIKRNVPYIVEGTPATYTFTGPNAVDDTHVLFGNGPLKGTMHDNYYFQDGDYILQSQNEKVAFYKYNGNGSDWAASPYRAFIQNKKSEATCMSLPDLSGETTAIKTTATTHKVAGIYSIGGVKLQQFQPGLNIIVDEQGNTHKVFIKK